jgi:uncharacterized membrane protein
MAHILIFIVAGSFLVSQFVSPRIQIIKHIPYAVFYTGSSYGSTMALLPIIVPIEWFGVGPYSCLLLPELQGLTFLLIRFLLRLWTVDQQRPC